MLSEPVLAFACGGLIGALSVYWWLQRISREFLLSRMIHQALLQSAQGMAILEPDGRIVFWNQSLAQLTGVLAEEAVGKGLNTIRPFPPDHPLVRMFSAVKDHPLGRPLGFRSQLLRPNHELAPILVSLTRFASEQSAPWLALLAITDISEAEQLRNRLQQALAEAESSVKKMTELDRLKSEFLAICSHELKTPLVSITGYLDLMASEKLGTLTAKQENALAISLRNATRLNVILSELLDFARMEAGKMRFEFTAQRLSTLLEECVGVVDPMVSKKRLKISLLIEPDLPFVSADISLLNRVIMNLLDNAIKFTPENGEIMVKSWREGDRVGVAISDSGIGIASDKVNRVKEPFFQADASDTRKTGGLGLGLAIVEKILAGHGSHLQIESQPDKGTTTQFFLKTTQRPGSSKMAAVKEPS